MKISLSLSFPKNFSWIRNTKKMDKNRIDDKSYRADDVQQLSGLVDRKESEAERAILEWKLFLDLDRANGPTNWNAFRIGRSAWPRRGKYLVCSRPVCARDSENSIKASKRSALACSLEWRRPSPPPPREAAATKRLICISNASSVDRWINTCSGGSSISLAF